MRKNIKRTSFIAISAVALTSVGVAFAAWTATGGGSATSQATTADAITTVVGANTAQLYPGGTGDLVIKMVNTNDYPVTINSVDATGAFDSDKTAACDAATGLTYTEPVTLALVVGANSTVEHTLVGAVSMSNASHNDCQGAIFTLPVSVSGLSSAS